MSTDPFHTAGLRFEERVEAATKGALDIQLYPQTLGGERELIEGTMLGTIELALTTTALQSGWVKEFGVFNFPYLFKSREDAFALLNGPIGQDLAKKWQTNGVTLLAYGENGYRQVYLKSTAKDAAALTGRKIRTLENPIFMGTLNAWGSSATPIPWPDTPGAVKTGIVDGLEVPLATALSAKLYEIVPHMVKTEHILTIMGFVGNTKFLEGLTAEQKKIVHDEAIEMLKHHQKLLIDGEPGWQLDWVKAGGTVTEVDLAALKAKVESVYTQHSADFADLIKQIRK